MELFANHFRYIFGGDYGSNVVLGDHGSSLSQMNGINGEVNEMNFDLISSLNVCLFNDQKAELDRPFLASEV